MRFLTAIVFGVGLISSDNDALALTLYENPVDVTTGCCEATAYVEATPFSVSQNAEITGGSIFVGGIFGIDAWDGTFEYWIFDEIGGLPGNTLTSGDAVVNSIIRTQMKFSSHLGYIYELYFDLVQPFQADADSTYWLGVHLSEDYIGDDIFWVGSTEDTTSVISFGGIFDNWYSGTTGKPKNPRGLSLRLTDNETNVGEQMDAVVPVPSQFVPLLCSLGVLGFFGVRRRRAI